MSYTILQSIIVYAIDKASNVSTFIRTYDKTFRWVSCQKKGHHTVTIIMFPISNEIHIADVFRNKCHILYLAICLYGKTASQNEHHFTYYSIIKYKCKHYLVKDKNTLHMNHKLLQGEGIRLFYTLLYTVPTSPYLLWKEPDK